MIYQVSIKTRNPDRWVPSSWNIESDNDSDAINKAIDLCNQEQVDYMGLHDENGRKVD